jgi:hypothetical protein
MYLQRPPKGKEPRFLARLCFSHVSCSKKYGFVGERAFRHKSPDPAVGASGGKENVNDARNLNRAVFWLEAV